MAPKKRRLSDLYRTGREAKFDDGSGEEPIVIWIQKLSAVDAETATRKAGAARAVVLMGAHDENSEEWRSAYSEAADLDRDQLVQIAIAEDYNRAVLRAESEVAAEKEWSEHDYLQGLHDAWTGELGGDGGLKFVYESDSEEDDRLEEAKRVFGEMKRYDEQVQKKLHGERESLARDYEDMSTDRLRRDAVGGYLTRRGELAWLNEFRRWVMFFGTRDVENHREPYFDSIVELDDLTAEMFDRLYREFESLNVEVTEGKDLPPTQDSSQQSDPADEGETAASSGPEALSA